MIGEADTVYPRPVVPTWLPTYRKGVLGQVTVSTRVTGLTHLYDPFDTVDAWIPIHGKIGANDGEVRSESLTYAAARHKTQCLTDNCRAKVTIEASPILAGESRVFICSDERMNSYYGMAILNNSVGTDKVWIVRGTSSIAVDKYQSTSVTITAGDEFEVWYDRANTTVRVYQNGSEVCHQYFAPADIPHGPGNRYTGVVIGASWWVDFGPKFSDFEAWDEDDPVAAIDDPVDADTVNAGWVEKFGMAGPDAVSPSTEVHKHLIYENSLGPAEAGGLQAAIRWTTALSTASAKVVVRLLRFGTGEFTVCVRSNAAMNSWVGIRFKQDASVHTIEAVTGEGPVSQTTRTTPASHKLKDRLAARAVVSKGDTYTITWNETTKTIRCYKGASTTALVTWATSTTFMPSAGDKYVGLNWYSGTISTGVEVASYQAYDVTPTQPLPE